VGAGLCALFLALLVFDPLVASAHADDAATAPSEDLPPDPGIPTVPESGGGETHPASISSNATEPPPGNGTSLWAPPSPILSDISLPLPTDFLEFREDASGWTYRTPFGVYGIPRQLPALFWVGDRPDGEALAVSAFTVFVASQIALPSSFNVSATNETFRVSYPLVVEPDTAVGTMTVWTNFTPSKAPKQSAVFQPAGGGDFWIEWLSVTTDTFLDEGNGTLDFSSIDRRDLDWNRTEARVGDDSNLSRWTRAVRFDWADAGNASLAVGKVPLPDGRVGSGLLITFEKNRTEVDPSTVATVSYNDVTRSAHQRKVVSWGAYTYAFFIDQCTACALQPDVIWYTSSRDGKAWSQPKPYSTTIQVNRAAGLDVAQVGGYIVVGYVNFLNAAIVEGFLGDGAITWGTQVTMPLHKWYASSPAVSIGANGILWMGWEEIYSGLHYVKYARSNKPFTAGSSFDSDWTQKVYEGAANASCSEALRPVALSNGTMMLLDYNPCSVTGKFRFKKYDPWADTLTEWYDWNIDLPTGAGVDPGTVFSVVADARDTVHALFQRSDGGVYHGALQTTCSQVTQLGSGSSPAYPTIGLDAYGTLHAYWIGPYGSGATVYYATGNFAADLRCPVFSAPMQPFSADTNPRWTTTAEHPLATAPVLYVQVDSTTYRVRFGAMPSPTDLGPIRDSPWSRPGLSPYQEYFQNLDEAVSPGNLLLTVRQADLEVPGRGLGLAVARVHAQPLILAGAPGSPYLYEASPFAPMGKGWQLEIPWVGSQYLHLWGGQMYRIEWTLDESGVEGTLGNVFENHVGEQFRLERILSFSPRGGWFISGYALRLPSGTTYNFWADGSPKNVVDPTGNNTITFGYTGSLLTSLRDASGRTVTFGYADGKLSSVGYGGKTIASYTYQGDVLTAVTDAAGRVTRFWYNSAAPGWLLAGIQYPTGGRSVYTYNTGYPVPFGTELYGLPVILRSVRDASNATMWGTSFSYTAMNGRILFSNVSFADGTYMEYNFYHVGLYSTVSRYAPPRGQLGRVRMWYSPQGAPSRVDTYNGAASKPSYSTESLSDEWGNVLYVRDASGHGQFLAFNGTRFGNTFTGGGELRKASDGLLLFEDFDLAGATVPWPVVDGTAALDRTQFDPTPPSLNLTATSPDTVAKASKGLSPPLGSGTLYADLRFRIPYRTPFPTNRAIYEFAFKDGISQLRIRPAVKEDSTGALVLGYFDSNANFQSCGADVRADVWHRLTIEANITPEPSSYNLYLDGVRPSTGCVGLPFVGVSGYGISVFELRVSYSGGTTYATIRVDDVKVNAGTSFKVTGLRRGQAVQVLDPEGATMAEVPSSAGTAVVNAIAYDPEAKVWRAFALGADTLRILSPWRTVEYLAPFHEFWGGSRYEYVRPVEVSSLARVETGFGRYQTMWLDDDTNKPPGDYQGSSDGAAWIWRSTGAAAAVGAQFHVSPWKVGYHAHYFVNANLGSPASGQFHIQYIRMKGSQFPVEILFEVFAGGQALPAYWGSEFICSQGYCFNPRAMGAIPYRPDAWIMLIVKTDDLGTNGRAANGVLYGLYGGAAIWDATALGDYNTGLVRISDLAVGQKVELMDPSGNVKATYTVASGDTAYLDVYAAGITAFPYAARFRVYAKDGTTVQYVSPIIEVYGGDLFSYTEPDFYVSGLKSDVRDRAVGAMTSATTAPLAPVLHLDMESVLGNGKMKDLSFSGNHAANYSTMPTTGVVGRARDFNGAAYMAIPNRDSLKPFVLTMSVWIKPDVLPTTSGTYRPIAEKYYNGGYLLSLDGARGGKIGWYVYYSSSAAQAIFSDNVPATGQWTHVVVVAQSGGNLEMYINGTRQADVKSLSAFVHNNDPFQVGRWFSHYFDGAIDELMVFDRALSADDVSILFQTQRHSGGHPLQKSFVKYNPAGLAVETKAYHNGRWISSSATYDAYGNLLSTKDPANHVVSYSYSALYGGAYPTKRTEVVSGASVTTFWTYDAQRGWRLSTILPNGLRVRYAYDALGRPTNTSYFPPLPSSAKLYLDMETPTDESPPRMRDLSGNGNAGTLVGTAAEVGPFGGMARKFNGTSDKVTTALDLPTGSMTLSAWVNAASLSSADNVKGVLAKRGTNNEWRFVVRSTGVLGFTAWSSNSVVTIDASSSSGISTGSFYHVAMTWDGTTVTFYINGASAGSGSKTGGAVQNTADTIKIGTDGDDPDRFWNGILDEVYVFDAVLPAADIQKLYWGSYGMYASRTVQYDDLGNTATVFDGNGHRTRYVFDVLGRLKERDRYDASGSLYSSESYVLDWRGLVTAYTNDNGSTYRYGYDGLGRPTSVQNPDLSSRTWSYVEGTLTYTRTAVDEVGRKRSTEISYANGAVKAIQEWNPAAQAWNVTSYTNDGLGRPVAVTDANGGVTRHVYDDLGRLVRTTFPDGTWEAYAYDDLGNLASKVDRAGRTTEYAYDEAGRLTRLTLRPSATSSYVQTFQYDAMGNLLLASNGTLRAYSVRDLFGRATKESLAVDSSNFSVSYGYDRVGNVLYIVYPDGTNVSYAYDGLDRATEIWIGGSKYVTLDYRKDDLVEFLTYYAGATYVQGSVYDDRGRLLRTYVAKGRTKYLDLQYTWNAASDVTQIVDAVASKTETYAYDGQDRLYQATGPWGNNGASLTLAYTYDAKGNWLTKKEGATTSYYVYDASKKDDRLCGVDTASGRTCSNAATRFTYDALGQRATRTSGTTTTSYAFDMGGLMTKVVSGTTTSTYTYDALGRRVKAVEGSTTTYFVYGGPDVLYTRSGTTDTDYVYAAGLLVLRKSGADVRYVHQDHLGNVRLVTYWSSNNVNTEFAARYKPFGEAVVLTDSADVRTRYTGEWLDPTGLYYLRARMYDPETGRFLSQDPVLGSLSMPQTLNRYAYVVNNPLKYVDPMGTSHDVPWWLNLLTLGLAEEVPHTIDWWNRASDAERWGFVAGILTAVGIGVAVGVSCVVAACAGLVLLAAGSAAFLGGSVGASLAYIGVTGALGGTPTREGLGHAFYWGGWAGAAGFGVGQAAGRALGLGKPEVTPEGVELSQHAGVPTKGGRLAAAAREVDVSLESIRLGGKPLLGLTSFTKSGSRSVIYLGTHARLFRSEQILMREIIVTDVHETLHRALGYGIGQERWIEDLAYWSLGW